MMMMNIQSYLFLNFNLQKPFLDMYIKAVINSKTRPSNHVLVRDML